MNRQKCNFSLEVTNFLKFFLIILLYLIGIQFNLSLADEPVSSPGTSNISKVNANILKSRISEVENDPNITDEHKKTLIALYQSSLSYVEQAHSFHEKTLQHRASLSTAPIEAEKIRARLKSLNSKPLEQKTPDDISLKEVERLLSLEQANLAALQTKIGQINSTLENYIRLPDQIRSRLNGIQVSLTSLKEELRLPRIETDPIERQAKSWVLDSRHEMLSKEATMLEQQLLTLEVQADLTRAEHDLTLAQLENSSQHRAYLENEADRLRRIEADRIQQDVDTAQRETADAHPVIQKLVQQNSYLSEAISNATNKLNDLDEQLIEVQQHYRSIEQEFQLARQRLEAAGLGRVHGQILINQRTQLPNIRLIEKGSEKRADDIADITLNIIGWQEEDRKMSQLSQWLEKAMSEFGVKADEEVKSQLEVHAKQRVLLLERVVEVGKSLRKALVEIDNANVKLRSIVESYDRYLSERLLWVRSTVPITKQDFRQLPDAISWLLAPENWLKTATILINGLFVTPLLWLALGLVSFLFLRKRTFRIHITDTAEKVRRIRTDQFSHTVNALFFTTLISLPWPLLLLIIGGVLEITHQGDIFQKAFAESLLALMPLIFCLTAYRALCMSDGVAERHFRWHNKTLVIIRRSIASAFTILLPLGFIATMLSGSGKPDYMETMGRLTLFTLELGFAFILAIVFHPERGVLSNTLQKNPASLLNKLRMVWYPFLVGVPLILALMTFGGYMYTSGVMLGSLVSVLWLALGLTVVHQAIMRWLMVTRRRLAFQAAIERREQKKAEESEEPEPVAAEGFEAQEEEVDLASLDSQTRRLVNTFITLATVLGLYFIWSDLLPALNMLENVTLWTYTGMVENVEETIPVTLADLALAAAITLGVYAAAKNLPALLEILLLQHSDLSHGSRYTLITLARYVITAIGIFLVFSNLGISWGNIQWLVAALSVGIGFGLQEIVANFISGLIILFERPVRVGDIVTIGNTSGVVSRIEIRATTIRSWDRQELLVPNKEFITGRLLNWTLSDKIVRILIPVGVEYGSDTELALKLMAEVAKENERVLEDPAPFLSFEGFGDNALNLFLRCYVEDVEHRLSVTTELHQAIDKKFRAARIGIAFPQRDLHIRSVPPLEIHTNQDPTLESSKHST